MRLSAMVPFAMTASLAACASAPPPATDWRAVNLMERNREGESHLALPTEMPGCSHLGMIRVTVPGDDAATRPFTGPPPAVLEQLKQRAANKGGNTVVVLPGLRLSGNALRGSVFRCP